MLAQELVEQEGLGPGCSVLVPQSDIARPELRDLLQAAGVQVELGSDQTSLHNPFGGGYYPAGLTFERSNELMRSDPAEFKKRVQESLRRQVARLANRWAWIAANTGRYPGTAVRYSLLANRLQPDTACYLDTLARCRFASGDLDRACSTQLQAVDAEIAALMSAGVLWKTELEHASSMILAGETLMLEVGEQASHSG